MWFKDFLSQTVSHTGHHTRGKGDEGGKKVPVVGSKAPVVGSKVPVVGSKVPVVGSKAPVVGSKARGTDRLTGRARRSVNSTARHQRDVKQTP